MDSSGFGKVGWETIHTVNAQIFTIGPLKIALFTRRWRKSTNNNDNDDGNDDDKKKKRKKRMQWTGTDSYDDRTISITNSFSRNLSITIDFLSRAQWSNTQHFVWFKFHSSPNRNTIYCEQSVNILSAHFNLLIVINATAVTIVGRRHCCRCYYCCDSTQYSVETHSLSTICMQFDPWCDTFNTNNRNIHTHTAGEKK